LLDLANKLALQLGLEIDLFMSTTLEHSMVLDAVGIAEELYSKYVKENKRLCFEDVLKCFWSSSMDRRKVLS